MREVTAYEITGKYLVKWFFDLMLKFEHPLDLVRTIFDSKIWVIDTKEAGEAKETGFLLLPDCSCDNCQALRDIVLSSIKEGKTQAVIEQEIELFKVECGRAQ